MPVAVPMISGLTNPSRKINETHRPGFGCCRPPVSSDQCRTMVSKQAYETPLITPKVRPSIKSSNWGRLARMTGPIWRMASPTTGTSRATIKKAPTRGDPLKSPPRVGVVKGTGPRRKVHRIVNAIDRTPVSANAKVVTETGSSSQRFTSYM